MNANNNSSNMSSQSTSGPPLLRMLHPTSGRQGFNDVYNPAAFQSQLAIDPRFASMINMQTQRAIAASGTPVGFPYQPAAMPGVPSYGYGIYQPYRFF